MLALKIRALRVHQKTLLIGRAPINGSAGRSCFYICYGRPRCSNDFNEIGCGLLRLPLSLKPTPRFKSEEISDMDEDHKTDTDRGEGNNHPRGTDALEFRFLFEVFFKA